MLTLGSYTEEIASSSARNRLLLRKFQAILTESLAKRNNAVGRRSAADIESPPPKKYKITKPHVSDVRYDQVAHWPVHEKKRNRCKWCTSGYSSWKYYKCQVMLCMVPDRNCLTAYHQKWVSIATTWKLLSSWDTFIIIKLQKNTMCLRLSFTMYIHTMK